MRSSSPYNFQNVEKKPSKRMVASDAPSVLDLEQAQERYKHFQHVFKIPLPASDVNQAQDPEEPGGPETDSGRDIGAPLVFKTRFPHAPLGFRTHQTCYDLASRFELSLDVLYCARIEADANICGVESCQYPALEQNRSCCALHKQNWWPRKSLDQVQKRRGYLLLGAEYAQRPGKSDIPTTREKGKFHPLPCQCSQKLCEGIGWSADTARVPKGTPLPSCIVPTISVRDKDRPLRLAPWHFSPECRVQLPNGTWKLTFSNDEDDFPSPEYDLEDFLEEPGMVEYQARKSSFLLPDWVLAMKEMEEGPLSLHEYQYRELVIQRNRLLEGLASQSVEHQELSLTHQQASTKLELMKRTHVHKKSPKRRQQEKAKRTPTKNPDGTPQLDGGSPPKKRSRTINLFRPVAPGGSQPFDNLDQEDDMSVGGRLMVGGGVSNNPVAAAAANNNANTNNGTMPLPPRPLADSDVLHYADTATVHEGAQAMHYLQQHQQLPIHHQQQQHQQQQPHEQRGQHHHNNMDHHSQQQQYHQHTFGGHTGGGSLYQFPTQQQHTAQTTMNHLQPPHHHYQQQQQQQQHQQQHQPLHSPAYYPMPMTGGGGGGSHEQDQHPNNNSQGGRSNNNGTTNNNTNEATNRNSGPAPSNNEDTNNNNNNSINGGENDDTATAGILRATERNTRERWGGFYHNNGNNNNGGGGGGSYR
jgi:hypothetical protein